MVIRHFRLKDRKNMNTTFICSDDLAYDVKLAKEYCERREEDVNAFMKTLPAWETLARDSSAFASVSRTVR